MLNFSFQEIRSLRFRANPNYELVLFDRLSAQEQRMLDGLQDDPTSYGVLRPRAASALTYKSIDRETALLYLTLQEPDHVPVYVQNLFGEESNDALASFVLNHILEIEVEGIFRSGAAAYAAITQGEIEFEPQSKLAQLSVQGLRYAQALQFQEISRVSMRLYLYNRLPLSAEWQSRLGAAEDVLKFLELEPEGRNRVVVDRYWSQISAPGAQEHWLMWQSLHGRHAKSANDATYKLYISPDPPAAAETLRAMLGVLARARAPMFKIGKDISGLLRPDKMVAYFRQREEMETVADTLTRELAGIKAHGVPFTAQLDEDGLLSWGMDPPGAERALSWQMRESWRLWVTNRLATSLVSAGGASGDGLEPWQFALARLKLDGVNPQTWAPNDTLWQINQEVQA